MFDNKFYIFNFFKEFKLQQKGFKISDDFTLVEYFDIYIRKMKNIL